MCWMLMLPNTLNVFKWCLVSSIFDPIQLVIVVFQLSFMAIETWKATEIVPTAVYIIFLAECLWNNQTNIIAIIIHFWPDLIQWYLLVRPRISNRLSHAGRALLKLLINIIVDHEFLGRPILINIAQNITLWCNLHYHSTAGTIIVWM